MAARAERTEKMRQTLLADKEKAAAEAAADSLKREQVNTNKRKNRQAKNRRRNPALSLFERLSPAESREARKVAYEAALAIIG
jgi:hypothetical protein